MRTSESIAQLAEALAKIAADIEDPAKTETAKTGKFSYDYTNLSRALPAIRRTCAKHGVSIVQALEADRLETMLVHTSGEFILTDYPVQVLGDPQAMGSAVTYARRYALFAALGIAPIEEDDDGAAAKAAVEGKKPARSKETPEQKALRQSSHDESWDQFCAQLKNLGYGLDYIDGYMAWSGSSRRCSQLTTAQRQKILDKIATDVETQEKLGRYDEYLQVDVPPSQVP